MAAETENPVKNSVEGTSEDVGEGDDLPPSLKEIRQHCSKLDALLADESTDSEEEITAFLKELNDLRLDLETLKHVKIGMLMNKLQKHWHSSHPDWSKLAADLVNKWKLVVKTQYVKEKEKDNIDVAEKRSRRDSVVSNVSVGSVASTSTSSDTDRHSSPDKQVPTEPDDATRSKSVQLLQEAMTCHESMKHLPKYLEKIHAEKEKKQKTATAVDDAPKVVTDASAIDPHLIAIKLEAAVYMEHDRKIEAPYKATIRHLVFNFRAKDNRKLRLKCLSGRLTPKELAVMPVEELASARVKRLRKSIEEETLHEHDLPLPTGGGAHSTMFQCHKCNARDATYNISEERQEGDYEPVAVTILVCNKCGNRWKRF